MTIRFRLKALHCCVGAAVAQLAIPAARADSAVGVDTMLGNALNTTTLSAFRKRDPEGLDAAHGERTPTGQLYDWAALPPTKTETKSGWAYSGWIEIGGLNTSGDTESAWFRQYKDLPDGAGLYLNNLNLQVEKADSAQFLEITGGGWGYDDQYAGAKFGRYNDWKAEIFYNETPHVFTSTYRSLWDNLGSDYLSLKSQKPGGTTNGATLAANQNATRANIVNELATTDYSELGIVRKKAGARVEKLITDQWRFFGSYSNEKREGTRPFGAVFGGGGGGGNIQIPESIDYDTHDILAGVRYDDGVNNLNFQFNANLFRNNVDTLTFENPMTVTVNTITGLLPAANPGSTFTKGRFDLYPDNDYYNLKAEYARALPEFYNGRFTAVASYSQSTQDDDLIPWSMYPLTGGLINGVSATNKWNTPASLSKASADAEIDIMMFDLGLVLKPTDDLSVKGKVRYYQTDNSTEYFACNPLTGQWGRLLNDGSGGAFAIPSAVVGENPVGTLPTAYNATRCNLAATQALGLVPAAGNINIRNIPFDYQQLNYILSGDYRLSPFSSLDATLEREEFDRDHRERDETWENKVKLGYVNNGLASGTLRISGEYGQRRGSDYNSDPYEEFYSASFGPYPTANTTNVASWIHTVSGLRKYDVADRDQGILNGRFNIMASESLDVGLTLQYKNIQYPNSDYGRDENQQMMSASLDFNYQPSDRLGLYGYYTYQQGSMSQTGVQANGCIIGNYYYFFSDGSVATNTNGVAPAPVNAGAVLQYTRRVTATNWEGICGTASNTSPLYPTGRDWNVESEDENQVFGLGGQYDFGRFKVLLDYTYAEGTTEISYKYNPAGLGRSFVASSLDGSGWPDLETTQNILDLSVLIPINKSLALRALYRYEDGSIEDWHYAGVANNPSPINPAAAASAPYYLDAGQQDYSVNVFGLFLHATF